MGITHVVSFDSTSHLAVALNIKLKNASYTHAVIYTCRSRVTNIGTDYWWMSNLSVLKRPGTVGTPASVTGNIKSVSGLGTRLSMAAARSRRDPKTGSSVYGGRYGNGYYGPLKTTPSLLGYMKERWSDPNVMIRDLGTAALLTGIGYKTFKTVKNFIRNRNTLAMVAGRSQGQFIGGESGSVSRYINGQRTSRYHELSKPEIASLRKDIKAIGADQSKFRFNQGFQTGYLDKKNLIYVKGDVLPDLNSTHPRDLMSSRAVFAYEYYGHNYFGNLYGNRNPMPGAWNDEFRASYNAALITPNLNYMDRMYLMMDALERAKEAGANITITDTMRRILYGY